MIDRPLASSYSATVSAHTLMVATIKNVKIKLNQTLWRRIHELPREPKPNQFTGKLRAAKRADTGYQLSRADYRHYRGRHIRHCLPNPALWALSQCRADYFAVCGHFMVYRSGAHHRYRAYGATISDFLQNSGYGHQRSLCWLFRSDYLCVFRRFRAGGSHARAAAG